MLQASLEQVDTAGNDEIASGVIIVRVRAVAMKVNQENSALYLHRKRFRFLHGIRVKSCFLNMQWRKRKATRPFWNDPPLELIVSDEM